MQNESYEVVAIVLPEESADQDCAMPHTVLVRIYENDCLDQLDRAVQNFLKAEKPESHYHTIPVGSAEDYIEYWIEFPYDATAIADKLRDQLSMIEALGTRARRVSSEGGTEHRPGGLAA